MSSLSVFDAADEADEAPALIVHGEVVSYGELADDARRLVRELPGDAAPVVLVPRRTRQGLATIHALLTARRPFAAIHPKLTPSERSALEGRVREARVDGARTLAVLFTSGSSGDPKGVLLSRAAFLASAAASAANLGWRDDDRWLLAMPLAHVGGLSILIRCLLARRCVVVAPEAAFDARSFAAQVERDRVTLLSLVPTMLARLLDLEPRWDPPMHVRAMLLGGAAAPEGLLARADDRGWPVLTTYGMTEACSQITTQPYGTRNRGELGAGRAVQGADLRIVDGEIQVRGPMMMDGYLAEPTPFLEGGWFPTGDLGTLDDRGNLHVVGRRSDRIITGGENVDPVEVERALLACPGVRAVCVAGVEDPEWGERVGALVVVASGVDEATLAAFASEHLAPHKRPRVWRMVQELPLTSSGKPDRRAASRRLAG